MRRHLRACGHSEAEIDAYIEQSRVRPGYRLKDLDSAAAEEQHAEEEADHEEDRDLNALADARAGQPVTKVRLDEL